MIIGTVFMETELQNKNQALEKQVMTLQEENLKVSSCIPINHPIHGL